MCYDSFIEKITVIDEWENGGEKFRIVNFGAGPDRLQIFVNNEWKDEKEYYKDGVLVNRIKMFIKDINILKIEKECLSEINCELISDKNKLINTIQKKEEK